MRLLHPVTIITVANEMSDEDFKNATVSRKEVISHVWSEIFKSLKSEKPHPKMFIHDKGDLGEYLFYVYYWGLTILDCNFNPRLVDKYPEVKAGFYGGYPISRLVTKYFSPDYLFSDMVSLYFKGVNMFKYVYKDDWRKMVPVESLDEIKRQVDKTLEKRRNK